MGTTWSVKLILPPGLSPDAVQAGIQHELDTVVGQMSTWLESSDLGRFNRAPAGSWHPLPREFFTVLEYALSVARDTAGAYDPTTGRLVNLWGFGPEGPRTDPPDPESIAAELARGGWERVQLDTSNRRALQPGGVYIDLSSIAKGFGVDQLARYLDRVSVMNYLVEVGGELRGRGFKPDGTPWWVTLERPAQDPGYPSPQSPETLIALHGLSVATSGDYRRYFEKDGARYSHTIDPRTGRPVHHRLASVTVIHRDCYVADAISTALTVLGAEEGMRYATRHRFAALFIERSGQELREHMTDAFAEMLE